MSNYYNNAQKRAGTHEIFPSLDTVQKPGGGKFIKPGTKTGAKSVSKWKSDAAKAKLDSVKFNLAQTFKKSDTALNKLKKTVKKQKKILDD